MQVRYPQIDACSSSQNDSVERKALLSLSVISNDNGGSQSPSSAETGVTHSSSDVRRGGGRRDSVSLAGDDFAAVEIPELQSEYTSTDEPHNIFHHSPLLFSSSLRELPNSGGKKPEGRVSLLKNFIVFNSKKQANDQLKKDDSKAGNFCSTVRFDNPPVLSPSRSAPSLIDFSDSSLFSRIP